MGAELKKQAIEERKVKKDKERHRRVTTQIEQEKKDKLKTA